MGSLKFLPLSIQQFWIKNCGRALDLDPAGATIECTGSLVANSAEQRTNGGFRWSWRFDVRGSTNGGTPKSSLIVGKFLYHPAVKRGTPIYGNPHVGFRESDSRAFWTPFHIGRVLGARWVRIMMHQNPCRSTSDIKPQLLGGSWLHHHQFRCCIRFQWNWSKLSLENSSCWLKIRENHGIRFRSPWNFIKIHSGDACEREWWRSSQWTQWGAECHFPLKSRCDPYDLYFARAYSVGILLLCTWFLYVFVVSWYSCRLFWVVPNLKGPCRNPCLRGLANTYGDTAKTI